MSYRKRHVKNKIYRIKPKKSIFKKLWFWVLLFSLAVIFSAFYGFFFYSGLQVKNIVISGNEKAKTAELKELISKNINTGLVNFWQIEISSKSIFLVNTKKLNKEILKNFPVIEKVNVNKNFPETLVLGIIERNPIGVYCAAQCFLIDQNGIAFEPLSILPEGLFIVRQTLNNEDVFTGENVIQKNIIEAIYKIEKNLKDNFKIDIKEALIASPTKLTVETSERWQIYFDLSPDSDINLQITKLNLLFKGEINPESRKNLKYINLAPKDRAIICDNKTCGE